MYCTELYFQDLKTSRTSQWINESIKFREWLNHVSANCNCCGTKIKFKGQAERLSVCVAWGSEWGNVIDTKRDSG